MKDRVGKVEAEKVVKRKLLHLKVTAELYTVNATSKDALKEFVLKMNNLTAK